MKTLSFSAQDLQPASVCPAIRPASEEKSGVINVPDEDENLSLARDDQGKFVPQRLMI